jgi:hypothetical protein
VLVNDSIQNFATSIGKGEFVSKGLNNNFLFANNISLSKI